MNEIQKQQQKIAYRGFVKDTQKVINALKSGETLDDLISNCELVCGHTCTDGYESEICNIKRWLQLLKEAEEKDMIPCKDIIRFLEYVVLEHHTVSIGGIIKKMLFKHFSYSYQDFRNTKFSITNHLRHLRIVGVNIAKKDSKIHSWMILLKNAEEMKIIPGGDLLDFLDFI